MVDGMLVKCGRLLQNVQIHLLETSEGVAICLKDEKGVFMEKSPGR